jgi:hypothetical protein
MIDELIGDNAAMVIDGRRGKCLRRNPYHCTHAHCLSYMNCWGFNWGLEVEMATDLDV